MNKTKILKLDKDFFPGDDWLKAYIETIVQVCKFYDVIVECIKITESRVKGLHFFIAIKPEIEAQKAVLLQFLLGDDSHRVDCNRAKIDSGLEEWNKLFWVVGRRFRTIYRNPRFLTRSSS